MIIMLGVVEPTSCVFVSSLESGKSFFKEVKEGLRTDCLEES